MHPARRAVRRISVAEVRFWEQGGDWGVGSAIRQEQPLGSGTLPRGLAAMEVAQQEKANCDENLLLPEILREGRLVTR